MHKTSGLVEHALIRDMALTLAPRSCAATAGDLPVNDCSYHFGPLRRDAASPRDTCRGTREARGTCRGTLRGIPAEGRYTECLRWDASSRRRPGSIRYGDPSSRTNGRTEYVVSDYLGSTRLLIDDARNTLQELSQRPFGVTSTSNGSGARTSYIGREHDNETDLGFFGVRLYEPEYGRFLSTDVLWAKYLPLQPYQYAGNEPVGKVDRNGKDFESFMKFYQVASRHLDAIQQMASSSSLEHGGWLVSNKGSDWVAWTGPIVSGGEYSVNKGTNHEEYLSRNGGRSPNAQYGESLIAGVHTHPSENSFSDQDANTFLGESLLRMNNSQESIVAKFNVVVTQEHVYGMEILDAKKLNEFVGNDDNKIRDTWTKLFQSAKGSITERTNAANKGLSKATGGAIGFYIVDRSTGAGKEAK